MKEYPPGYFEALRAKHPYPGGWRENTRPTDVENAATKILPRIGRGDSFAAAASRAAYLGAAYLFPDRLESEYSVSECRKGNGERRTIGPML